MTRMPFPHLRRVLMCLVALASAFPAPGAHAQRLLVPMDDAQTNHLKAYGLTYNTMKAGVVAEWLLNYRGGSFLLPDAPETRRRAALDGISVELVSDASLATLRRELGGGNMESVPLEKAPRIAVYTPPDAQPWDDAVTLALKYAGIDFTPIYDTELEWARALRRRGDVRGAIARLEHLILGSPQSALLPQARRELEQARRSIPSP